MPRHAAVAAYRHERDGDLATAARLYAEAAHKAPGLASRDHLTRQAPRAQRSPAKGVLLGVVMRRGRVVGCSGHHAPAGQCGLGRAAARRGGGGRRLSFPVLPVRLQPLGHRGAVCGRKHVMVRAVEVDGSGETVRPRLGEKSN